MKIITIIINFVLFGFTCLVLLTDGLPKEVTYIVFTFLTLFIPVLSIIVILTIRGSIDLPGFHLKNKVSEEGGAINVLSSPVILSESKNLLHLNRTLLITFNK